MDKNDKIYVAGHRGLAGSAIVRELRRQGCHNLVVRSHAELDLEDPRATRQFFERERPRIVFLAAAKVGGIHANNVYPVDFLMNNLLIEANVCRAAHAAGVERLIFLGSSCIYPRDCAQPIKEEYLLTGPLEATNRPYALAKIAGIEMCRSYNRQYGTKWLAAMPTNLYGPGDNYDPDNAHVLPALLRRMHEAKISGASEVALWGSGAPMREFLYVDDLANALVFLAALDEERYGALVDPAQCPLINIGTGTDLTIRELAEKIADAVGYKGKFVQDISKPDGTMRKVLDVSRMTQLGWHYKTGLNSGLALTYDDFLNLRTTCPMKLSDVLKNATLKQNREDAVLRLHIGGRQRKDGWKILDVQARPEVDFVGDITDLSRFPDGGVADIYASHVLEHIPQTKMVETLLGLRRALKDGGRLMISVPDMDVLCRLFLDKNLSLDERFDVMRIIFGGQVDANDFHYVGLNMELLVDLLRATGFSRMRRVESFGLFNDTSDFTVKGIPISLNVEAWK